MRLDTMTRRVPDTIHHAEGTPVKVVTGDESELRSADAVLRRTSVVIPVRDDIRIFACVDSIDEDAVEVVVVSNGSPPEFTRMLKRFLADRVTLVVVREAGIGRAYNSGIEAASGRYILLMDSDCTFAEGAVRQLAHGIGTASLVKGRLTFATAGLTTRMAAGVRTATEDSLRSGRASAYSPPLLYDRQIVTQMGGYHFADDLAWREDRDFELRRRAAGLPVAFAPLATITHAPLPVLSDLRSAFNYGRGEALGRTLGLFPAEKRGSRLGKTARTALRILRKDRSPTIALYFLCRRAVFQMGLRSFNSRADG